MDWVMKCNLYAPITLSRGFVRHWLGLGAALKEETAEKPSLGRIAGDKRILCVSSISGLVNMSPQRQVAYNASKAGLTMACRVRFLQTVALGELITQTLAGEWAPYGVTINTVSPGYVSTDMISDTPSGEGASWVEKWKRDTPVDRFADPSEIGRMIVIMCSSEASTFMTGHDLVIDGGESATPTFTRCEAYAHPAGFTTY